MQSKLTVWLINKIYSTFSGKMYATKRESNCTN
jgi:hypothetical protein